MAEKKGEKMIGSYDIKVPEDTDVTLGYDMTANKVKNFKFSGIWTWIVSKLKGESISDLNTTNKTVVGAIKEVNTPTFTTATSRTNINSGESQSIIMGKVKKWLADLGTAAFCSVVNNLTTTAEGSVLDARQGKNLSDALNKLNTLMGNTDISAIGGGTLTGAINELNSKPILPYSTSVSEYSSFYEMPSGIYFLYGDHYKNFSDIPKGVRGRITWLYQNVRDERIGILLCANSENIYLGKCYGSNKLTWVVK